MIRSSMISPGVEDALAGTMFISSVSPISALVVGAFVFRQLARAVQFPFTQQSVTPATALLGCRRHQFSPCRDRFVPDRHTYSGLAGYRRLWTIMSGCVRLRAYSTPI